MLGNDRSVGVVGQTSGVAVGELGVAMLALIDVVGEIAAVVGSGEVDTWANETARDDFVAPGRGLPSGSATAFGSATGPRGREGHVDGSCMAGQMVDQASDGPGRSE